jgi:CCR4-NOT transcriptional regulation complex NOT5 subunit
MQYSEFDKTDYSTQVKDLQNAFLGVLEDFITYYVFYHKNPDYSEYQTNFENAKSNLSGFITKLFRLSNSVKMSTSKINGNMEEINKSIQENKENCSKLKKRIVQLKEAHSTSDIMVNDYVTIYNIYYLKNAAILLGILLEVWILMKVFSVQQ